jgi:hypothetical protein
LVGLFDLEVLGELEQVVDRQDAQIFTKMTASATSDAVTGANVARNIFLYTEEECSLSVGVRSSGLQIDMACERRRSMDALTALVYTNGGVLTLSVLGALARSAHDYLARCQRADRKLPPQEAPPEPELPQEAPASQPKRMAWWGQQLVSHEGMLGCLLTPLEGVVLVVNSYVIAISLEVIFHHPGAPLFEINIVGWERIVTVFDLYGLLISLAQSIGASVCYQAAEHKRSMVWICAMAALTSLVAFEVGTACYRGLLLGGSVNACLSSLFAFGIAMIHVVVGIRVIHSFLVPLLLTFLWLPLAPFCLVFEWAKRRRRKYRELRSGNRILRALAVPLAAFDTGVMKPLRLLDHLAFRMLSRITPRMQPSHPEGGNTYATEMYLLL